MCNTVMYISVVVHIRVPRRVKEKLEEYGVNISEEVRRFLEARLRQIELEKILDEIEEELAEAPQVSDSTRLIREDREKR